MQTDKAKAALLASQAELEARLQRTHKHIYGKEEAVSAQFDEQIKQTENDQLVYALEDEAREELNQIRRALVRLEEGNYGQCVRCGQTIAAKRLEAVPFAEFCIGCASASQGTA
jgi:DnaK suppressor protein